MPKLTPSLWFNGNAEEAINFYTSVFKNSRIHNISRSGPEGEVAVATFSLDGQEFMAINAGPEFPFTEAVSFAIDCADQAEVDYFWNTLTEGGEPSRCGWLKDKFGLSWQVIPSALGRLMQDADPATAGRVMQAVMQMTKLDVAALEAAAAGE